MSMRNYWSETEGPPPTPAEELKQRGRRSLLGILASSAVAFSILWALSALLS